MLLTQSLLSDENGSNSYEQATKKQDKAGNDAREVSATDAAVDFQVGLAEDSPYILEAKVVNSWTVLQSIVNLFLDIWGDGNEESTFMVIILGGKPDCV